MCHVKIIDTDNYVTKSYKYFKDLIYQIHYEFCSIFMRIIKYNLQQQIVFFFFIYNQIVEKDRCISLRLYSSVHSGADPEITSSHKSNYLRY